MKQRIAAQSRVRLDERVAQFGPPERYRTPPKGWIRAIRQALGMTTAQLADRMSIRQPTLAGLERSEANGTIQLETLRRAAEALDCTLIYALVPNRPLVTTVRERARAFLRKRRQPIEHTMLLEGQGVATRVTEAQVDDLLREINVRRLWD